MNMRSPAPIALLTDFGTQDAYVGMMKGVILRLCPAIPLIDLTHEIAAQNIRQAAFVLWTAYRYFPARTTFLTVVDPGVGSARRPVAIECGGFNFVGPDNGVFSEVLLEAEHWRAVAIDEYLALTEGLTATFHGRDLFAPTAARLACGAPLDTLGAATDRLVILPPPHLLITPNSIEGEVIYIDHFGNIVTSIGLFKWDMDGHLVLQPRLESAGQALRFAPDRVILYLRHLALSGIARTYTAAAPGEAIALINSAGQLEIAINQGSAGRTLGLQTGERIVIRLLE